jgi:hypothetical protein
MSKKQTLKTFHVNARINLDTTIEISAKDLDEAVAKGKTLDINDFIEIVGDHNDSSFRVSGIFEGYEAL